MSVPTAVEGIVRAIFAYEFDDLDITGMGDIDAIRQGRVENWVTVVSDAGLLSNDAVRDLNVAWRANPELLVDALLDGADEVTRRRLKSSRALPVVAPDVSAS